MRGPTHPDSPLGIDDKVGFPPPAAPDAATTTFRSDRRDELGPRGGDFQYNRNAAISGRFDPTLSRRAILRGMVGLTIGTTLGWPYRLVAKSNSSTRRNPGALKTDVLIVGGGLGSCAAALAVLRMGYRVVLTEPTDWIGGQLTQQGVPPDEHRWIESHGCTATYRQWRNGVRDYYRQHYPLTDAARREANLNPGKAWVSGIAHEPRVSLAVLQAMLQPYLSRGEIVLRLEHEPVSADVVGDTVRAVTLRDVRNNARLTVEAPYVLDASELGDLLPLARAEFVTGAESQSATGEPHAPLKSDPHNQQAFTCCFAMDYRPGEDHTIDRPAEYGFWRDFVPRLRPPWTGRLLSFECPHPRTLERRTLGFHPAGDTPVNLWTYRRIVASSHFAPGTYPGDVTVVNWPQNDYFLGNLVGVSPEQACRHIERGRQLSLSLLYWLQTEAPRPDGGTGWRGLRLRPDVMGTSHGTAKHPYVRESRRIRAEFTVVEQHMSRSLREQQTGQSGPDLRAAPFSDSVGIGSYAVDLHPTTAGDNYIDFDAVPFQIPLGALIPIRLRNLLPAAKNIGTTHITNGAYRLHPIEWNIGEAAGALAAFCLQNRCLPREVRERGTLLADYQQRLDQLGIERHWR